MNIKSVTGFRGLVFGLAMLALLPAFQSSAWGQTTYTLTVIEGVGQQGTVTSTDTASQINQTSQTQINCINGAGICQASFPSGDLVTLQASPASGWAFSGWSVCNGQLSCSVVMNTPLSVTAIFTPCSSSGCALASDTPTYGFGVPACSTSLSDGTPCTDSESESTQLSGVLQWAEAIFNNGNSTLIDPTIAISTGLPASAFQGGATPAGTSVSSLSSGVQLPFSFSLSSPVTFTPGFDSSRTVSPVMIPAGAAQTQTVTVTVTPIDSRYFVNPPTEIGLQFGNFVAGPGAPGTSTPNLQFVSAAPVGTGWTASPTSTGGETFVNGGPNIWFLNNPAQYTTYTFTFLVTVNNPNPFPVSFKANVDVNMTVYYPPLNPSCGDSISISDSLLDGSVIYKAASPVCWSAVTQNGYNIAYWSGNNTLSVTSSANPSISGDAVTFTATVTLLNGVTGTPSGSVAFYNGTTLLGIGTLSNGVATLTTSALAEGSQSVTAVYSGDTNFSGSTSQPMTQHVTSTITTSLVSSANPSIPGQAVTFTATLGWSGPDSPTGSVSFMDSGGNLGSAPVSQGGATFTTSSLGLGSHSITAVYSGDSNFLGSNSSVLVQIVQLPATTTTLSSSPDPSALGQSVTFTATVSAVPPASGTPYGTVTFMDGNNSLGSWNLSQSGKAIFSISNLSVGQHSITATYGGNSNFSGSTSPAITQTVNPPPLAIVTGPTLGTFSIGEIQYALSASNGTGAYTWSLTGGTLPPGLALRTDTPSWFPSNASAGLIGVATTPGTYSFTLQVTNGTQSASQTFSMKITGLVGMESSCYQLPDAFVGQSPAYSYSLSALNNAGPVTWTATSNVPAGITLGSNGVLSGTPTQAGQYNINYTIYDTVDTVPVCSSLNVSLVQVTSPGVLLNATQNASYSGYTATASGGTPPYTFSVNGLPSGLTLNSSTGVISGTVTQGPGHYTLNLTAMDSNNVSYTKTLALMVTGVPPMLPSLFTYGNFDDCSIGMECERQIGVGGGAAPFTWSVTGLPTGMSFRTPGGNMQYRTAPTDVELYGVPSIAGTYYVQATVTDSTGAAATETFPLNVSPLLIDGNDILPGGTRGLAYSKLLRVLGGSTSPAYTAKMPPGLLPDGLSLNGMTVSGTPLENGNFGPDFTFTETVSNSTLHFTEYFSIGDSGTSTISLNQYDFAIPASPNDVIGYYTVGSTLSRQLNACCASSYTWSQLGGMLPPGILLSTGGLLSGTFTTAGTYSFLVQAANGTNTGAQQYTIVVTQLNITTSNPLPYGNVGTYYSVTLSSNMTPTTFTLMPGYYLPPGLSMSAGGAITGTPLDTGQYSFYVQGTDSSGEVFIEQFSIAIYANGVYPPPAMGNGPNLGTFSIGEIQYALSASGGNGTYTWSLTGGALPPGLALRTDVPSGFPSNASAGIIGLATAASSTPYQFTLSVTSGGQTATQTFSMKVTGLTLKIDGFLPDAFIGVPYNYTITALNNANGNFTVLNPSTQCGLALSSSGVISGTPASTGLCNFQGVTYTDGVDTVSQSVMVNVYAIHFTNSGVLPNATNNAPYSSTFAASGGTPPYTFMASSLPPGLMLSSSTGQITGTPTDGTGRQMMHVTVTDSANNSYTETMMLDILGTPPVLPGLGIGAGSGYLDDCSYGVPVYNRYIATQYGGTAPFTYAVTGLPSGMDYRIANGNGNGANTAGDLQLWGTPVQMGTFNITVTAKDANGTTVTETFPFTISPMVQDVSDGLPNGTLGVLYSKTLRVLGGTAPYSAQLAPNLPGHNDVLPAGLGLSGMQVSGTPQENGNAFYPEFVFSDGSGHTLRIGESPKIGPGTVTINQNYDLGTVTVGASYSNQLSACCVASYTWSPAGGNWPPGIGISSSGLLSGMPTTAGTYIFLVKAADNNSSNYGVGQFQLVVTPLNITTGNTLPYGNVGTSYSQTLTATGGSGSYTWAVVAGTFLPPGLTLSSTGVLSGTPTSSGIYYFYVAVTDSNNNVNWKQFNVSIYAAGAYPPLSLGTGPNLGTLTLGSHNFQLTASGGNPPYHYSLTPGATTVPGYRVQDGTPLPSGFSLSGGTGGFLGVLTTPGTWATSIRVTDASGTTFDRAVSIGATSLTILNPGGPPNATMGSSYSFTFTGYGGSGPYTWSASNLPAGLSMNSATGAISGAPTVSGSFPATVTITDSTQLSVDYNYTIIVDPFAITAGGVLPQGTINVSYSQTLSAPGCGSNCTWSISNGVLPNGLSLNSSGAITGTPTGNTNGNFTVQVSGSNGTVQKRFTLVVPFNTPQPLSISTTSPMTNPIGYTTVGSTFTTSLFAQGGTPPYTWSVANGSTLPSGLSLQTPCENVESGSNPGFTCLAGRVMAVGSGPGSSFTFTLRVTDAVSSTAAETFTFIASPMAFNVGSWPISNPSPGTYATSTTYYPPLIYNRAYTQPQVVSGGSGNYTSWTTPLAGNPMPPGLSMNSTGVITGTPTNTGNFTTFMQVTDNSGNVLAQYISFDISANTATTINIGLGPSLGTFAVGGSNVFNINPSGGTAPYTITALSALPPGCSIETGSGNYDLACTYSQVGSFAFTLQAQDSAGNIGVRTMYITVNQGTPVITWPTPAAITYGTALSATQLDATANVAGAFVYNPAAGTILAVGSQTLSVTFTPTDTTDYTSATASVTITVNQPALSLAIGPPPGAGPSLGTLTLGPHNFQLTAIGGNPPYHYSLTPGFATVPGYRVQDGGPLPPGFSLSGGTGGFLGVLTTPGTWNTSIRVTDASGTTYDRAISIGATSLNMLNNSAYDPPNATMGSSYSFTFTGYGGAGPYTWSASNLPVGLSMNPATGTIAGTPSVSGNFSANITITDSTPVSVSFGYPVIVDPFAITTNGILPQGTIGVAYSQTLSAPGCGNNCTWSITGGSLPNGLSLNSSGAITGTPSGFSNSTFTVQASGSNGTVQKQFALLVPFNTPQPLLITTASSIYEPLSYTPNVPLLAQGGTPPYTWSVANGSALPPGLSLQAPGENVLSLSDPGATCLAGKVMEAGTGPGSSFTFTLHVTDAATNTATQTFTFIASPMALANNRWPPSPAAGTYAANPTVYPPLIYNMPYTQPQVVLGGSGNYTSWTNPLASNPLPPGLSNPLPPGLSVNPSTGVITGTPTNTGSFTTLMQVTDSSGNVLDQYSVFNIAANTPATINISLPPDLGTFAVGGNNIFNIDPSGGTPPYTITALSPLPPGCAIQTGSGSYDLACSYQEAGNFAFTLKAQDSAGNIGVLTMNLTVNQGTPVITWPTPAAITYGTPLSATQLDATASVSGTFAYTPTAGTVLSAGTRTLSVTFTPGDTTDYTTATASVTITVNKAPPVITWSTPSAITYGTALSAAQLNATASVTGAFVYNPAAATVLKAGSGQTLSVTFTPTDTTDYTTAAASVTITVNQAAPVITWSTPAAITYGTALSAAQLDATASVPGAFAYTPPAATVLKAGSGQTLSVAFTPTDTTDYTSATATVTITVNQAAPLITWPTPAAITYGTALSAAQLDATASVPGTLVYAQAAGTVLSAGSRTLSVTFTPTDTTDYTSTAVSVTITINQATPAITWVTPAAITYGTALSSTQLNATASVAGAFAYTPAAGIVLPAGNQPLLVTFTPTDTTDYTSAAASVTIAVNKATPAITWSTPAAITYGTALSATQLNATASVPGAFVYKPAVGAVLSAGTQALSVTFTPTNTTDYTTVTAGTTINVNKAILTVTANSVTRPYGTANPTLTATVSGFVNGDPATVVSGSPALATTATAASLPGTYPITVALGTLAAANYSFNLVGGTLTVAFTASAPSSGGNCNGAYNGTFNGNLIVSAGQNCVFVNGGVTGNVQQSGGNVTLIQSEVGGNMQVNGGGTFTVGPGSTIKGDLQVQSIPSGSAQNQVCGSTVKGDLQFQSNGTAVEIGSASPASCAGNTISGNLTVQSNSAATTVVGNTVGGNLTVQSNSAATIVTGNTVTGNLQDQSNTAPTQVSNNGVGGNLVCQSNTSITGGGNTAKSKQGQCSAF